MACSFLQVEEICPDQKRHLEHFQGSIYWGDGGKLPPQTSQLPPPKKKSFTEKKITAISNKDLF